MSIRITSFASLLRKQAKEMPRQIRKGLRAGVRRGKAVLVRRTPRYLGEMANSWSDREMSSGAQLHNDAPHAGVVERGARPHGVNAEGREAIEVWFMRQRGLTEIEAKAAAAGYIEKLKREGQEGLFIVEKALDELKKLAQVEIERLIFAGVKP